MAGSSLIVRLAYCENGTESVRTNNENPQALLFRLHEFNEACPRNLFSVLLARPALAPGKTRHRDVTVTKLTGSIRRAHLELNSARFDLHVYREFLDKNLHDTPSLWTVVAFLPK